MTHTSHGHHIPTSPRDDEQANVPKARCGGAHLCKVCKTEFAAYLETKKEKGTAMPESYSSRPERIEAQMLTETNGTNAGRWTGGSWDDGLLAIPTFEGVEYIEPGMYVVKDLQTGRFRGMSAENFKRRYQHAGTGDSGEQEYVGMQFESEEDLQAHNQRRDQDAWRGYR